MSGDGDSRSSAYLTASPASPISSRSVSGLSARSLRDEPHPSRLRAAPTHYEHVPPLPSSPLHTSVTHFVQLPTREPQQPSFSTRPAGGSNVRRRQRQPPMASISMSSEDPDGIRVTHDQRPAYSGSHPRWTRSTLATSISHYPHSSSDMTHTESSSDLHTPTESTSDALPAINSEDENENPHYHLDPNDVSYRLRLLVKNSYYLPPAHSKPANIGRPSLPDAQTAPIKSTSTIRDIFRIGSPRVRRDSSAAPHSSKVPLASTESKLPLRGNNMNRRATSPPRPNSGEFASEKERKGRVVVIRERLDEGTDFSRAISNLQLPVPSTPLTNMSFHVDPTDVVDLPSFGLEPHASLSINSQPHSSVLAFPLADITPNSNALQRALNPDDEAWRRALLMQAVDLSMSSIPEMSERTRGAPSSMDPNPSTKSSSDPHSDASLSSHPASISKLSRIVTNNASTGPHRVDLESDSERSTRNIGSSIPLVTALPPPPRKRAKPPPITVYPALDAPTANASEWQTIRKTLSIPLLSESVGLEVPSPQLASPVGTESEAHQLPTEATNDSLSSGSYYSDDGGETGDLTPRFSKDASTIASYRPSFSISHRSHASSAFGLFSNGSLSNLGHGSKRDSQGLGASLRPQYPPSRTSFAAGRTVSPFEVVPEESETNNSRGTHIQSRPRSRTLSDSSPHRPRKAPLSPAFVHQDRFVGRGDSFSESRATVKPFESLDPTKPITNTPQTSNARVFIHSRRSPRIPESTFELLKHDYQIDPPESSSSPQLDPAGSDQVRNDEGKPTPGTDRILDGMLKLHIEAERDHLRRITSHLRGAS